MSDEHDDRPVFEEVWKPVLDLWEPKFTGRGKADLLRYYLFVSPLVDQTGDLFLEKLKTAEEVVQALEKTERLGRERHETEKRGS